MAYTCRVLRNCEAADRRGIYDQVRSVLKPGGFFVVGAVTAAVGLPARQREGVENTPIFDEFYEAPALKAELASNGFAPVAFIDVIRHMRMQQSIQVLVGPRSPALARALIQFLEYVPGTPLEWIVVCRRSEQVEK